jgi:hypothetical protein
MRLGLLCLCLSLTGPALGLPWRTSNQARLQVNQVPGGFQLTLTNTQRRPLALLPPSSGWCHGWEVRVQDRAGQDYGLMIPPGPAFMAEPSRFRVLQPQETLTVSYRFGDFSRVNRKTDSLERLTQPAVAEVAYVLQPNQELTQATQRGSLAPPVQGQSGQPLDKSWTQLFQKTDFLTPLRTRLKL